VVSFSIIAKTTNITQVSRRQKGNRVTQFPAKSLDPGKWSWYGVESHG